MNDVFAYYIGILIKVYINNMLVKMLGDRRLVFDLETVFGCLCKHKMRLNPQKYSFTIKAGKFLGFMVTHQGIEANSNKCQAILEMTRPTSMKEVHHLIGRTASLSRFMVASARKALPFFLLL